MFYSELYILSVYKCLYHLSNIHFVRLSWEALESRTQLVRMIDVRARALLVSWKFYLSRQTRLEMRLNQ